MAEVLDERIAEAVRRLREGDCVAFPTETVYGLGADASRADPVARIYALKGRPADHPVIVHVLGARGLGHWASTVPRSAQRLAEAFWPGPLTLVLPRAPHVLDAITGGQDTVGLRCPAHPLARALLAACEAVGIHGLAAPSANRFGHVSPTTAAHVRAEFGAQLWVLDGGPCEVGIESTIIDLSTGVPRLLRPGMISRASIEAVLGRAVEGGADAGPRVSGSLAAHYAPARPLRILAWTALRTQLAGAPAGLRHAVLARHSDPGDTPGLCLWQEMPSTPEDYARALYAALRAADMAPVDCILIESLPAGPEWEGPRDRLSRAAAGSGRGAD